MDTRESNKVETGLAGLAVKLVLMRPKGNTEMTHFTNRQAIQTKFLSPTNSRGSRVKAFAAAGSVTISWDHRLNPENNHRAAAEMFANRMNWVGAWAAGTLPGGDMVFVNCEEACQYAFFVHDVSDLKISSNDELLAELTA
jgi:hypothetical protein